MECGFDEVFFVAVLYDQVEWIVALDEEGGPVVAMDWRVEVESVVVGRSSGQVRKLPIMWKILWTWNSERVFFLVFRC